MDMKQAVKFTFDTRFDDGDVMSAPRTQVKTRFSKEEFDLAKSEAYAAGLAAGRAEAAAESDREIGGAMQSFAANAASLLAALQAESAALRGEAIALAMTAARKLAPALVATRPEAEIEAVLRDCLQHLNREPHIVLRVADNLIERLKETVDRMALERGLTGRIILLAQNDIAEGDCIVEWADGGVVRSRAESEQEMNDIISRFIETLSNPRAARDRLAMPETR
ncbi:MAG TPA: FliH/SctL family protein [Parvibaculum sp.]